MLDATWTLMLSIILSLFLRGDVKEINFTLSGYGLGCGLCTSWLLCLTASLGLRVKYFAIFVEF